ncbi:hypothetical protein [Paracoccus sp. DMF]|uniref:hypothetical protein n=1 Tax=Paracoccus sp. DMF TaxID=400837 RepID=UPI00110525C2|nr:hypothetical protein [Paracoccus sp. DMF]MCV2448873.1 hypothetical protein [Paracoccus sp. DMF]
MSNHDACRRMWRTVAALALKDDNVRITAARAGRNYTPGTANLRDGLRTLEGEIRVASAYYHGRDWQQVCENAGIGFDPEKAMAFVTGGPKAIHSARVKVLEASHG